MIDIRQELKNKGIAQSSIAQMLKVKPASVHNVVTGKRKTPRIRAAIAMAIGKPVGEIWPDEETDAQGTK
ncbi:MAG: helix-turn-helix domain-containing protein [Desulfobacula sp.]|jgi:lambda repressor-like predicted transcriptional regulator